MNRLRARRLGAATCVAAIGLLWWPAPAGAEGDVEAGWWYRLSGQQTAAPASSTAGAASSPKQAPPTLPPSPAPVPTVPIGDEPPGAPGAVPPPAAVPEGGLYVANDAFGPLAIAALRFPVGQVGETELTLRFAEGAGGAALPIVACPLLEGFQAVQNGAWRDRPAHDCARASTSGTLDAAGNLVFRLSGTFQVAGQTTLDVVLLPEPGNGSPFSAPFEAVTAEDLAVQGPAPVRTTSTTAAGFQPDPTAPAASGATATGTAGRRPSPGRPASSGAAGSPTVPTAQPSAGGAVAGSPSPGVQPVAQLLDDRPWARWVATALLGALAVALAAGSTGRLPMLAGAGAGVHGVGRFARHRHGPPPALG